MHPEPRTLNPESCGKPLLAIETSGQSLGVALINESGIIFEKNVTAGMIHGKELGPLIEEALLIPLLLPRPAPAVPERQRGERGGGKSIKPVDLEAVAVSLGPGSWTGLRIGISAAKTFAWAAGIKVMGVPSFEALALSAMERAPGHAVLTLRDARSEGFFLALFGETHGTLQRWIPETVLQPKEAARIIEQALRSHPGVPLAVCGDCKCLDEFAQLAQAHGWNRLHELNHIPAGAVARRGWERLKRGEGVLRSAEEVHRLSPLYLRASDPELKLKKMER